MWIRQIIDRLMQSISPCRRIVQAGSLHEGPVRGTRNQWIRKVPEELLEQRGHTVHIMVKGSRVPKVQRSVRRLVGKGFAEGGDLESCQRSSMGGMVVSTKAIDAGIVKQRGLHIKGAVGKS